MQQRNIRLGQSAPYGCQTPAASRSLDPASISASRRRALAPFRPKISPSASRLASGRTGSVAVITPYIARWFFATLLAGVAGLFLYQQKQARGGDIRAAIGKIFGANMYVSPALLAGALLDRLAR